MKYEIDFAGNILALIEIKDGKPNVIACIDGGGYAVNSLNITIKEIDNDEN